MTASFSPAVTPHPSPERPPEIRVFISSTFRDMQDEREYIIKHVFPELRTICRERGVEFTEIDLRWGVTAEEAEQGKVLKICLDEIDRCRPYFIGILGERYGWVPNAEDVKKDPDLVTTHPWIIPCIESGTSVTEMEMLYGVLENPAMADHAFFYFRDEAKTAPQFRETDPTIAGKLSLLKDRIRSSSFPSHENFPDPQSLGELIREDLLAVINRNYPMSEAPSPLEQKRRIQDAYALTRRRAYIARSSYIDRLNAHAESEEAPIVLTGESGTGKSSLLAYWAHEYKQRNPGAFIIKHFIGAGASDSSHAEIILRIIEEIKERYGLEDDIPTTPVQLETDFSSWLAKIQKENLILIIDSLDRLSSISALLHWLPNYFPPHIRVFLSTAGNQTLDILQNRGYEIFVVEPLTTEECDKLIIRYLGEYRKALSPAQRKLITDDPKSANPLFLRTVLEELRIFGSFEELQSRIGYYMESYDTSDLFQRVLFRMENDYGRDVLDIILRLLWASRQGLAETEIIEIAGISRLQFSTILHALEFQLMRRQGLLDFYHVFLRTAVEERYFKRAEKSGTGSGSLYTDSHLQIASYFQQKEISARKAAELPWQYEQAGRLDLLRDAISDIPMFLEFDKSEKHFELLGYWRKIGDLSLMEQSYDGHMQSTNGTAAEFAGDLYDKLGNFFKECGRNVLTERYFEKAVELRSARFGDDDERTEESRFHLAALKWWIQGDYEGARILFLKILKSKQAKAGKKDSEFARILYYLGTLEQLEAHYAEAEKLFHEAIAIIEGQRGSAHYEMAPPLNKLACLYLEKGDYSAAEPLFVKAYEICERTFGKEHPTTIEAFHNLAELYYKKGEKLRAEKCYRIEIAQLEKIYGREHPNTILGLNNLASTLLGNGELEEAEKIFREALELETTVFGTENFHTAGTLNNLAETLDALGKYDQSEELYIASWKTLENIFGSGHPINAHPIQGLGKLWLNKGNPAMAAEYFEQAFLIRQRALGSHPETMHSLESYLDVVQQYGSKTKADELLAQLHSMKEDIAKN